VISNSASELEQEGTGMPHRSAGHEARREPRRARRARVLLPTTVLAASLGLAAIALAARTSFTVTPAHSSTLGEEIVVDGHGATLYALSPETTRHLLCKGDECLRFWPPLTVASRSAKLKPGAGVKGKLGLFRRKHGVFQVTLRGMPLYRFSGDHGAGQTNGQGIKSFGGTWFAATASRGSRKGQKGAQGGQGTPGANGNGNNGNQGAPPAPTPGATTTTTSTSAATTMTTTSTTYTYPHY
jgi:predicted lipoprotein with Yx(FWY)xxD motif